MNRCNGMIQVGTNREPNKRISNFWECHRENHCFPGNIFDEWERATSQDGSRD